MTKKKNFTGFLESLKGRGQDNLIESVKKGFQVCFESDDETVHEKTLTFKFRNSEKSVAQLLELFKNKNKGVLILDPEGDMDEPVTAFVIPEYKSKSDSYRNRFRIYETNVYANDEDNMKRCEIIVKSDDKEDLDKTINNFKNLFDNIGKIGNCGHSYSIKFVPNSNQAKIREIGWDGDGSDYIDTKSIKQQ